MGGVRVWVMSCSCVHSICVSSRLVEEQGYKSQRNPNRSRAQKSTNCLLTCLADVEQLSLALDFLRRVSDKMEDGVREVAPPILRFWEKFYNGVIDYYLQIHNDLDTHQMDQPPGVCCVLGYWKKVTWETPNPSYEYIRTGSHQILDVWTRMQKIIMPEYIAMNSQSKRKELLIMEKLGRAESCPEEGRMAPPLAIVRLRRMHAGTNGICVVYNAKTPRQIIPLPVCWRCGLANQENEQLRFCSRKCQRWVCTSHTCWIGDNYVSCVDCAS